MSDRPARVRIIAASANAAFADRLAIELHARGFEIVSGEESRELNDAVVVVWSGASISSKGLIDAALGPLRDNILVPVSIGRIEPPAPFRGLPAIDLAGWSGDRGDPRFAALADAIAQAGGPGRPPVIRAPVTDFASAPVAPPPSEVGDLFEEESALRATAPAAPRPPPRRVSPAAAVLSLGALGLLGAFAALVATRSLPPPGAERAAAENDHPTTETDAPTIAHVAPADAPDAEEQPAEPSPAPETRADEPAEEPSGNVAPETAEPAPALRDGPVDALAAAETNVPPAPSLAAAPADHAGAFFKDCAECPEMAAIPAGSFLMGSPANEPSRNESEGPQTGVRLTRPFAIGTREVTFEQWETCVADGACNAYRPPTEGWGKGRRPVIAVSWRDAQGYADWLSQKTGKRYRLPTEAEWEYAARAGAKTPFFFGASVSPAQANFNGRMTYGAARGINRRKTTEVASFEPNAFGLYDMHGNVWEWVADCWAPDHAGASADGSARTAEACAERTLKGGAWNSGGWRLRAGHRIGKSETIREIDNGFRVARDLD